MLDAWVWSKNHAHYTGHVKSQLIRRGNELNDNELLSTTMTSATPLLWVNVLLPHGTNRSNIVWSSQRQTAKLTIFFGSLDHRQFLDF